jgi:hypothetical protein
MGAENEGLLARIINRFSDTFNRRSIGGRWMNGLLNVFRPLQRNKPKYMISTDVFVKSLSMYSTKTKALAVLIRNESALHMLEGFDTDITNIITTTLEWAAQNMESLAAVIDPIIEDLGQNTTVDLATVTCSMGQLLTHLRDKTVPNMRSISEFIDNHSDHTSMEQQTHDNSLTTRTTPSDALAKYKSQWAKSNPCVATTITNDSNILTTSSFMTATRPFPVLTDLYTLLVDVVGSILKFKISLVTSIILFLFTTYFKIVQLIFPVDESCEIACGLEGYFILLIAFTIIIAILSALFDSILPDDPVPEDEPTGVLTNQLLDVLESPMERMVDRLIRTNRHDNSNDETEFDLDCNLKILSCHNDALMAAMPF